MGQRTQNAYQPLEFVIYKGITFGRATKAYNESYKHPFSGQEINKKYEGMPLFDGEPEHLDTYIELLLDEMGLRGAMLQFSGSMTETAKGYYEGGFYDLPIHNFFVNDGGVNGETQWPVNMGFAHSWNKELIRKAGEIYGVEIRGQQPINTISGSRSSAAHCAMIDMRYNPLCGRFDEGFGEDSYLISEMAYHWANSVTGRESNKDLYYRVIPQTKHWACYNTEFFRGQNSNNVSVRSFYENNAKTAELGFRNGAFLGYCSSYGCINGIPSTASFAQKYAQKLAPHGVMTSCDAGSDSGYIEMTATSSGFSNGYDTTYSSNFEDKAASMILAGHEPGRGGFGLQIDMYNVLKNAIDNGVLGLKKEDLNQLVKPYLYAAVHIGAMDLRDQEGNPVYYPFNDFAKGGFKHRDHFDSEHQRIAKQASIESVVLVKNDGMLPLSKEEKVAVFGRFADVVQYGLYSSKMYEIEEYNGEVGTAGISTLEALREKLGQERVVFENGDQVFSLIYDGKYLTANLDGTLYFSQEKTEGSMFELADWGQSCISIYSPFSHKWFSSGAVVSLPSFGPAPKLKKDEEKETTKVPESAAPLLDAEEEEDDTPAMFIPGPDAMIGNANRPNCNKNLTVYASADAAFRPETKSSFLVHCQFPEFFERKQMPSGFVLKSGSKVNAIDFGTRSSVHSLMGWYLHEKDGKLMVDADPHSSDSKALEVENGGFDGHYIFKEEVEAPFGTAALRTVEHTDYAIVFLGLPYNGISGEGADRLSYDMAEGQIAMAHNVAEAYAKQGKKTVAIVRMDAPAGLKSLQEDPNINAILIMPTNGQYEATALADILYGDAAPTGRLNATWYSSIDALPPFTPYCMPIRAKVSLPGSRTGQLVTFDQVATTVDPTAMDLQQCKLTYRYIEHQDKILYPFGYGLSYSTFRINQLEMPDHLQAGNTIPVSVIIKNTGKVDTADIIQIYVVKQTPAYGDYAAKKVLAAFEKVFLKSGEEKKITLTINPETIAIWDVNQGAYLVEGGAYVVYVAESSDLATGNVLSKEIILEGPGVGNLDVSRKINLWKRSYASHKVGYRELSKARTAEAIRGDQQEWDETFTVMSMSDQSWIALKNVPLDQLTTAEWTAASELEANAFEVRMNHPDGPLLGKAEFGRTGMVSYRRYAEQPEFDAGIVRELGYTKVAMQLAPSSGVHDLFVVFGNPDMRLAEVSFKTLAES